MAVPDTLLNAIRAPASAGKNPLEKLEAAPFAGADGSGFASVMRDAALPPERGKSATQGGDEQLPGNDLPELPEMPARFFGSNRQPASDATLEEFAVEMGIDRSLARLLLKGTANDEVATASVGLPSEPPAVTEPSLKLTASEIVKGENKAEDTPTPQPWFIVPSPAVRVDPAVTVRSEVDVQAGATIPSQLKLENTVQPLADEDLLLWQASVGRAHGLVTLSEETPQDAQLPIAKTAPSSMLPPSAEQSMNEVLLRRSSSFGGGIDLAPRSMAVTGLEGIPVATDNSLIADELVVTAGGGDTRIATRQSAIAATLDGMPQDAQLPIAKTAPSSMLPPSAEQSMNIATRQSAIATNPDNKIRSIHELVLRRASMDVDATVSAQQAKSLPPSEIDTNLAQAMANIASSSVSATAPTTVPSAAPDLAATTVIAAVAVSAEGAGQGQASAGQGLLTGGSETSQVLSAPDPKLTFGERAQAFADAVAQRVLGQIRNENWSVSLQLDPANLGAMEIDLTLRGNAVTANLGVANAEVRALLEAGLPRLKESLEASGLQLANWSFGQSGSRGFGESMPTPFAWQPLRGTTDDADSSADATRLATMRHNEGSRSAVDLFV